MHKNHYLNFVYKCNIYFIILHKIIFKILTAKNIIINVNILLAVLLIINAMCMV